MINPLNCRVLEKATIHYKKDLNWRVFIKINLKILIAGQSVKMEQPIFSSTGDANGNAYTYSELDQLSSSSSVIDVKTDPLSKLDHVVLGDGPFQFSQ